MSLCGRANGYESVAKWRPSSIRAAQALPLGSWREARVASVRSRMVLQFAGIANASYFRSACDDCCGPAIEVSRLLPTEGGSVDNPSYCTHIRRALRSKQLAFRVPGTLDSRRIPLHRQGKPRSLRGTFELTGIPSFSS